MPTFDVPTYDVQQGGIYSDSSYVFWTQARRNWWLVQQFLQVNLNRLMSFEK